MSPKVFFYTLCIALIAIFTVGCQSSQMLPEGTYTTELGAEILPADLPPDVIGFLSGHWELTFADGKVVGTKDGEKFVEGTYYANKDKITITDTGGEGSATSAEEATGEYQWKLEGNQLTFVPLNEKSMGRQLVLASTPWTKK